MAGLEELSARLVAARESLGWSQSELARQATLVARQANPRGAVTQSDVSRLEAGANLRASAAKLVWIATALGVSVDYLLRGGQVPAHIYVDPFDPRIEQAMRDLNVYSQPPRDQALARSIFRRSLEARLRREAESPPEPHSEENQAG